MIFTSQYQHELGSESEREKNPVKFKCIKIVLYVPVWVPPKKTKLKYCNHPLIDILNLLKS